jgi:ABC-type lipoprotein release transport system permease subunit
MLATLVLAWRNIWRNRRRTIINLSAIGLGLAIVIIYGGLMGGIMGEAKSQLDSSGLGHVELTAPGWRTHRAAKDLLADPQALLARLASALPPGSDVSARLVLRGLASSAHGNEAVEVQGVDFASEATVADYVRAVRVGAVPAVDDARGLLVGEELARRLALTVGSKVRVMVQRADGEMGAELYRVRGIYHAVTTGISRRRVLMTSDAATTLSGLAGAHQVVIQLAQPADADRLAAALKASLGPGVEVATYTELFPMFKTMDALMDNAILVASLFVYLLVGLGILNTMLMSVLERTREFGVMQALGTRPSGVVGLVLAESFWIASLAVVLGLTLGLSLTWYGSHTVLLDYSKAMGEGIDMGGAVIKAAFFTEFSIPNALKAARAVYVMALLVGLFPAYRVASMRPVQALHAR